MSPTFDASRFLDEYSRDRVGCLIVYLLLFEQGATDWVSKARVGYDKGSTALNEGFLPEWHHIFPKAVLRDVGRSEGDANLLANMTVLNEATNRHKLRAKPPAQYVPQFGISAGELSGHFVPGDVALTASNYDEFIYRRAGMLADAANAFFRRLREVC